MKTTIDKHMEKRIKKFVTNFKNIAEDPDIDLWEWCWGAIDLLEEILENK